MKIGVFDSGRGGEFVADRLRKLLPEHSYLVVNDRTHVPYGSRTDQEVAQLTENALLPLFQQACPIIVIACNTATMAAIATLREKHPNVRFVGTEPMVKTAAIVSTTRHATILATPLTLKSDRYRHLIDMYAQEIQLDEPNTAGWAAAIENSRSELIDLDVVARSLKSRSDTIVLACTHYLTLEERLGKEFPGITLLEPTHAIAQQINALVTSWAWRS